jgi:hypothetical protein
MRIDLSRIGAINIDASRRIAIVGPAVRASALDSAARKAGMVAEIVTPADLDFTFADWAEESLRMLSTSNSGVDGILRNVKVIAPAQSYQTGYDSFPANGGGYDLTKLFISSGMTLGIPYEFTVTLKPIPDSTVIRTYSFAKLDDAVATARRISKSVFSSHVKMQSGGFDDLLVGPGSKKAIGEYLIITKVCGTKPVADVSMKAIDDMVSKASGKVVGDRPDEPRFIDPSSISNGCWPMGICVCDTGALADVVKRLSDLADKANRAFQFSIPDVTPATSVLLPLLQGPPSDSILNSIGTMLADARITLRGNQFWNPLLGDSRAVARLEVIRGIKRLIDPKMILNPHVLEAFQ